MQAVKARDFQYGYNQIMASLSADIVLFNSDWNRKSFLENISKHLKLIPDFRPKELHLEIEPKTRFVLKYFVDYKSVWNC